MLTATTLQILFLWLSYHNLLLLLVKQNISGGDNRPQGFNLLHIFETISFLNLQCKPLFLIQQIIKRRSFGCGWTVVQL